MGENETVEYIRDENDKNKDTIEDIESDRF